MYIGNIEVVIKNCRKGERKVFVQILKELKKELKEIMTIKKKYSFKMDILNKRRLVLDYFFVTENIQVYELFFKTYFVKEDNGNFVLRKMKFPTNKTFESIESLASDNVYFNWDILKTFL
ncbi:MAG: hypothetical protein ACRC4M_05270 [Mycoplasma sp.]